MHRQQFGFVAGVLIFLGAVIGSLISTPVLNLIYDFFTKRPFAHAFGDDVSSLISYYNAIIILLLTLLPLTIGFAYFYIKGASEDFAKTTAESIAVKYLHDEIEKMNSELSARQSDLAFKISPFLQPIIRSEVEIYINERQGNMGSDYQQGIKPEDIVFKWIGDLQNNGDIDAKQYRQLLNFLNEKPPEYGSE